jgi:hypothetical protein
MGSKGRKGFERESERKKGRRLERTECGKGKVTGEGRKRRRGGSDGMKEERRTEGPGGEVKGTKAGKVGETGTGEKMKE